MILVGVIILIYEFNGLIVLMICLHFVATLIVVSQLFFEKFDVYWCSVAIFLYSISTTIYDRCYICTESSRLISSFQLGLSFSSRG